MNNSTNAKDVPKNRVNGEPNYRPFVPPHRYTLREREIARATPAIVHDSTTSLKTPGEKLLAA